MRRRKATRQWAVSKEHKEEGHAYVLMVSSKLPDTSVPATSDFSWITHSEDTQCVWPLARERTRLLMGATVTAMVATLLGPITTIPSTNMVGGGAAGGP